MGYCQPPITPGHEFIGEVVFLGAGAAQKYGLELGDHVVSEQIVPCWHCVYCRKGSYHLCMLINIIMIMKGCHSLYYSNILIIVARTAAHYSTNDDNSTDDMNKSIISYIATSVIDKFDDNDDKFTHLGLPHDIYGFRQATPGAMAQYLKFPKGALNYKVC